MLTILHNAVPTLRRPKLSGTDEEVPPSMEATTLLHILSSGPSVAEFDLNIKKLYKTLKTLNGEQKRLACNTIWDGISQYRCFPDIELTDTLRFTSPRQLIGEGHLGTVYQAEFLGKKVAVKLLDKEWNPEAVQLMMTNPKNSIVFFRAIREWQKLPPHRNVLAVLGYYFRKSSGEIGVVSELAHSNMRIWAEDHREDPSCDRKRLNFILQAARGLHHLHENKVIHGDLRASNILLLEDEQGDIISQLSDFAILPLGDQQSSLTMVVDQHPSRHPWFAPESISRENRFGTYSNKSDLFSFARAILEIYTGQDPFHGQETAPDLKTFILESNLPAKPVELDQGLWEILVKYWSFKPEQRGTLAELITYLEGLTSTF
ncbi:kinase-like domain-containing protein [Mycena floridula]|nr:kinase-like domain-containing protein [Mycena floridula]